MKNMTRLLIPLLIGASVLSAQTVSTDPVGYVTTTINGSPDGSTPAYTALSVGLQNAALVSGSATSDSTSAVITDSNASNAVDAYAATDPAGASSFFLQITSGTNEGLILDILSNGADSFTTNTDLSGIVSAGDSYVVKAHVTLADIFGASNETGLKSGGNSSSSDSIFLMSNDGAGSYSTYYYQTDALGFLGGNGWRVAGNSSTDMGGIAIAPDDGVIISRTAAGDLSTVVSGTVNNVNHSRDLPNGYSLVAYPFPVDVTLADSNIYTAENGYVSGGNGSSSDTVYVLDSTGSFTAYYYQTDSLGFLGGNGWRVVGDSSTSKADAVISADSSVIIFHRGTGLQWADAVPYSL
jgi:uncharacterized protein (TIGR02597 family)